MIDVWFPHYVIVSHGIFILYDYHLTLKGVLPIFI